MGGIFLFQNGRRWQRVQYDQDETIVKYRERSNVTFWTVFNEGASAVPISSGAKVVLNDSADTSIGYDIYEHGKVHWFEFMQLLQSPIKVAVLYNCANGRCTGNVQNFVVQASQDSRNGSDGTWYTGTYSGGYPILYANEATNIREITFPIGNIRMLRVACQGVAWKLSDRIHTIKIYTLDDERKHRDFRGGVWVSTTQTTVPIVDMTRALFFNATVGVGTTINVLLSNIRLSATITNTTSTSTAFLGFLHELVGNVTASSLTSEPVTFIRGQLESSITSSSITTTPTLNVLHELFASTSATTSTTVPILDNIVATMDWTGAGATAGVTNLAFTKPATTAEGDLLLVAVITRNKYISASGGPEGSGWNLLVGVDISTGGINNPWTKAYNEQAGVWWKIAGASEPSTFNLALQDSGTDYAYGYCVAVKDVTSIKDWNISTTPTVASVEQQINRMVIGFWGTSYDNPEVFNGTVTAPFTVDNTVNDYGGSALGTALAHSVPPSTGPSGAITIGHDGIDDYNFSILVSLE